MTLRERTATAAVLFLLAAPVLAQQSVPDRIIDIELRESLAWETLSYLTDKIGPRLSGSPQAATAVEWTTNRLREWGLEVRNEPIMVPHWVRGAEEARLVAPASHRIVLTTLGGSIATPPAGLTAEVVEVTSYEELKALGEQVKGKIVLYNKAMDREKVEAGQSFQAYGEAVIFRGSGASRAAEYGAVAALVRSVTSSSLRTPHTGGMRYDPKFPRIPAAAITTEDADLIHRLLARGERVRMFLRLTPRTFEDAPSANVVAELKGRENNREVVLLGAHLDSWDLGTGAIDNGSGVAMVMETMRLLKEMDLQPRRTIRAVLYMNEENGLRGGRGYAAAHKDEIPNHVAAIESDAGTDAPLGFITTLDETRIAALKPLLTSLERLGATRLEHSDETGADTSPLTRAGVPGFGLSTVNTRYFDYHHTPADTLDKVDPGKLTMNAAAIAALAWVLADMPERFPHTPRANAQ